LGVYDLLIIETGNREEKPELRSKEEEVTRRAMRNIGKPKIGKG